MKKIAVAGIFFMLFLLFAPDAVVWAEGLVPCGKDGGSACTLCDLIVGFYNITTYLTKLLVIVSLAGLFFSGVMYAISAGDEGMMTSAKNFAKSVLIGFSLVLCAWLIINVTMWVISANMNNIGHLSWYEFAC